MKKPIPLWIVASLGKTVLLTVEYVGPCETYLVGAPGVLSSIQVGEDGEAYVTVALDANDPGYFENFGFGDVRPETDAVTFQLDLERGLVMPVG